MQYPFFTTNPLYAGLFWAVFGLRGLAEMVGGARRRSMPRASDMDRGSRTLLVTTILIGLALAFAFAWRWPGMAERTYPVPVFAAELVLSPPGVGLRSYSMAILGRFFTHDVSVQNGQYVVRDGPYRYVRHPCYSGSLMNLLGVGLALTNWASLAVLATCALAGYAYRISVEERALAEGLGEDYVSYMRETKRLIPFLV